MRVLLLALVLVLIGVSAHSKEIEFIISAEPGGGFDVYGRHLAKYLPDHIAGNPKIVVKNMAGADGLVGMSYSMRSGKIEIGRAHV